MADPARQMRGATRRDMGIPLSTYTTSRDNNFNLIRFVAAWLVLYTHSYALTFGTGEAEPLRSSLGITWGTIAVDIFFITSGFLITSSYFARQNIIAFVWARVLRIYPALVVAILFCVFGVGLWFTTVSPLEYFQDVQTYRYIFKNSILFLGVEYKLPGVFLQVPYKEAVNGSLWTLPYEVKMYVILAAVLVLIAYTDARLGFFSARSVMLIIGVASIAAHFFSHFQGILPEIFVRLFSMFFVGSMIFLWRDKVYLSTSYALIILTCILVSAINKDWFFVVYCLGLPYLVFYAAYVPAGGIRKFNNFGDYSYGVYIYAFPVQQSIAQLVPGGTVWAMITGSFLITLVLAILSWHIVEKYFLKMKGSYIRIEEFAQKTALTRRFKCNK